MRTRYLVTTKGDDWMVHNLVTGKIDIVATFPEAEAITGLDDSIILYQL